MGENILQEINVQLGQLKKQYQDKCNQYNIFNVLEISQKEVIMCRMLADLLNPRGAHHKGYIYLRSFLTDVLDIKDITGEALEQACVYKEYVIPESRKRIDIVIKVGNRFIPIEVKIDAQDQKAQCYDYYMYAKEVMEDEEAKVYYLTKYGEMPLESSICYKDERGNGDILPLDKIVPISFKGHVCEWLRKIIKEQNGDMQEVLEQFLIAIEEATGIMDENMVNKVKDIILESPSSFNAALMIEQCIEKAKVENIRLLFDEFKKQMNKKMDFFQVKLVDIGEDSWYSYAQQVDYFYKKQKSSYPGINYLIETTNMKAGRQLWLRIEVEEVLYAGLCMFDSKASEGEGLQIDEMNTRIKTEIMKCVKLTEIDNDGWWITWLYLPTGRQNDIDDDMIPDFKAMNEAAIALADADCRKEFVEKSIKIMEEKLLSLIVIEEED